MVCLTVALAVRYSPHLSDWSIDSLASHWSTATTPHHAFKLFVLGQNLYTVFVSALMLGVRPLGGHLLVDLSAWQGRATHKASTDFYTINMYFSHFNLVSE
jgi:hypothetical protein